MPRLRALELVGPALAVERDGRRGRNLVLVVDRQRVAEVVQRALDRQGVRQCEVVEPMADR